MTQRNTALVVQGDIKESQQLPDEISSWVSLLQAFPKDLRVPLEQMGNILSKIVRLPPKHETSGLFNPNGIDGIHSQVNYERLLTSEWALLHDYPDEFIRRAAFGEHQFYKLAHQERTKDEVVYVLFDCGPEQLGRPRVVQLALLILFLRYAEALNAKLHWGVLQDNTEQWYEGVTPALVEQWLKLTSADLLDKTLLQKRLDTLSKEVSNKNIWCITPERLDEFTQLVQVVIKGETQDQRKMTVKVGPLNRQQAQHLQLPADQLCNQIMSDPFKKIIPAKNLAKPWHLNFNSAFLIVLNKSRYLKSYRADTRKPRVQLAISEQATLLGVFVNKRHTAVLSAVGDEYILQGFPTTFKRRSYKKSHRVEVNNDLPQMIVIKKSTSVLLLDHKHNLRCLRFSGSQCISETIAQSVYALGNDGNYFYYITFNRAEKSLILHWSSTDSYVLTFAKTKTLSTQVQAHPSEIFIDHNHWSQKNSGAVAFKNSETQWYISTPEQDELLLISVPIDQQVIGIERSHSVTNKPVLVSMSKYDSQTFSFIGEDFQEVFYTLPEPCCNAELNPQKPLLHYQTHQGLLKTVSLKGNDDAISLDLNA